MDRTSFALGDRVAGIVHGCQYSHTGAFAEYVVTDAEVCFKVPPEIALEAACTLGVGWVSAVQALAQRLYLDEGGLEGKDDDDDTVSRSPNPNRFWGCLLMFCIAAHLQCCNRDGHMYNPTDSTRASLDIHHRTCESAAPRDAKETRSARGFRL